VDIPHFTLALTSAQFTGP